MCTVLHFSLQVFNNLEIFFPGTAGIFYGRSAREGVASPFYMALFGKPRNRSKGESISVRGRMF